MGFALFRSNTHSCSSSGTYGSSARFFLAKLTFYTQFRLNANATASSCAEREKKKVEFQELISLKTKRL